MTLTKPRISERETAAAVVKHLESQGLRVRQEVYVTLPDHGQCCADIVACKTDETGEWFMVVEAKRTLSREVLAQAERWQPFANAVAVAHRTPKRNGGVHQWISRQMFSGGIRRYSIGEAGPIHEHDVWNNAPEYHTDTRLIAAAFHSHDGSADLASGTAAGHRMNGDRALLCELAELIGEGPPAHVRNFKALPKYRRLTEHQLCKLIDENRLWPKLPLDYNRQKSPTEFFVRA